MEIETFNKAGDMLENVSKLENHLRQIRMHRSVSKVVLYTGPSIVTLNLEEYGNGQQKLLDDYIVQVEAKISELKAEFQSL